ncbi:MAG: homocysteine S-methyltransferase family protein [Candidatus Aminicenantaceae bacterium]
MAASIFNLIKERVVLLDGGMGTELIRHGLPQGACPETWNTENPKIVKKIHKSYFEAGSDVVLTNSFGGNKIKLSSYSLEHKCYELNYAAATLANEVKPEGKYVAGSIGPTGKFLKPQGEFTEEEFQDAFAEQVKGLTEGEVDFLLIETQYDLREARCALKAAKEVSHLPHFVTMTFNRNPRGFFTLMGNSVSQCVEELEAEGISALGTNCTLNSADMADLVKIIRAETALPIIAQANAGQPSLSSDGKVSYSQSSEDYVKYIPEMIKNGANLVGGCCGTDPSYIEKMFKLINNL